MFSTIRRAAKVAALALAVTVVTQVIYMAVSSAGQTPDRQLIWSTEVLAYLALTMAGLVMLPERRLPGAALAICGLLNVVQVGIGLVMFTPLLDAGEGLAPVFGAVLAFAFLLYFAGKLTLGVGTVASGWSLLQGASGGKRWLGGLALLAGSAAVVANALAIASKADLTVVAGATGTLAAGLLVALLLVAPDRAGTD